MSGEATPTRTEPLGLHVAAPRVPSPKAGSRVGRYVLLETIGAGGMGVVHAAYDPQLDRKVAIKLLADRRGLAPMADERERLVAEAQALARLSHPNVVAVHDVGVDEAGRVFVAMEYVRGQTLGRWRHAAERSWREVVEMLVAAGRGLVAAHAERIVHRDFKPDNVLVEHATAGGPGRPRVLDFGLAMQVDDGGRIEAELSELDESLTRRRRLSSDAAASDGPLVGTPAYMAPEQYLGLASDARSDQFSFCVTAWELLYGARPFLGGTQVAVAAAIVSGPIADVPAATDVPRFVEAALRRGLSKEPDDRWPSMQALLAALSADPRRTWKRRVALGAVLVGAGAGWAVLASKADADRCGHGAVRVAEAWGPDGRERMAQAFARTNLPYAAQSVTTVSEGLDDYAQAWAGAYRAACEATHVRGEQSAARLDARMGCLQTHLDALAATVQLMGEGSAAVVEHAAEAVAVLPELSRCDRVGLAGIGPALPDPAIAVAVQDLRQRAAAVRPSVYVGQAAEASTTLGALVTEAEALDYAPVLAEMLLSRGHAESMGGQTAAAIQTLQQAAFTAMACRHERIEAEAASLLVRVEGIEASHYEVAERWAAHASAAVARLESPGQTATLLAYRRCRVLSDRGEIEAAMPQCQRAADGFAEAKGPDHIDTLGARQGLGIAQYLAGRLDEAEPTFRAAYEASLRVRGPDHPRHAIPLQLLAAICYSRNRGAECVEPFAKAHRAAVAADGPDHPRVADYANNLALAYLSADRVADAEAMANEAMRIRKVAGAAHPGIAASHRILSSVAQARGQLVEATTHLDAAVQGARDTRGPHHLDVVTGLRMRADVWLARGDPAAALADLEAAMEAREGITVPPSTVASVQWRLGRTLLQVDPSQSARATALVRAAQQGFAPDAEAQAEIAAWLNAHADGAEAKTGLARDAVWDATAEAGAPPRPEGE